MRTKGLVILTIITASLIITSCNSNTDHKTPLEYVDMLLSTTTKLQKKPGPGIWIPTEDRRRISSRVQRYIGQTKGGKLYYLCLEYVPAMSEMGT